MKASLFFILLLSLGFCIVVYGQEIENNEPSQILIASDVKREIVRRILVFKFKPPSRHKVVYLAKGDIDASWLPQISNVEFRLLSDEEIEDREKGVYWSQNASQSYALSVQDFSCYPLLKMIEVKT